MKILRVFLVLGLAFIAGCLASRAAPFVVPPARAAGVQRWEYMYFQSSDISDAKSKLNQAGQQGWESTEVVGDAWFMKRPVP